MSSQSCEQVSTRSSLDRGISCLPRDVDLYTRLVILVDHSEWKVLHISLYVLIIELAPNHSLDVEDRPVWIRRVLVLCRVSD